MRGPVYQFPAFYYFCYHHQNYSAELMSRKHIYTLLSLHKYFFTCLILAAPICNLHVQFFFFADNRTSCLLTNGILSLLSFLSSRLHNQPSLSTINLISCAQLKSLRFCLPKRTPGRVSKDLGTACSLNVEVKCDDILFSRPFLILRSYSIHFLYVCRRFASSIISGK